MIRKLSALLCLLLLGLGGALPAFAADDLKSELVYRTNLGRADDVALLLKQGASANSTDSNGVPLLSLAAARLDKEGVNVVETLLANGADLNARDAEGQSALFYAARRGNMDMVKYLLDKDINYYAVDNSGNIARNVAFAHGHKDVQEFMDTFVTEQTKKRNTEYQEFNKAVADRILKEQEDAKRAIEEQKKLQEEQVKQAAEAGKPAETAEVEPEPEPVDTAKMEEMKKGRNDLNTQLAFQNCAFQYWSYTEAVGKSTELGEDGLRTTIRAHRDKAQELIDALVKKHKVLHKTVNRISVSAKERIFNELSKMKSNTQRHEEGVGKIEDMQKRCDLIAEDWNMRPPGIIKPPVSKSSRSYGGRGGIGPVGSGGKKAAPASRPKTKVSVPAADEEAVAPPARRSSNYPGNNYSGQRSRASDRDYYDRTRNYDRSREREYEEDRDYRRDRR